jgi:hypothetical protein
VDAAAAVAAVAEAVVARAAAQIEAVEVEAEAQPQPAPEMHRPVRRKLAVDAEPQRRARIGRRAGLNTPRPMIS